MDVLSDVLNAVRLTGAVFFDVERRAPWVVETPEGAVIACKVMPEAHHVIVFHAVLKGECWVEAPAIPGASIHLHEGDVIILPQADRHVLCSSPGMRAGSEIENSCRPDNRPLPFFIGPGEGTGNATHFVCGCLACDVWAFNPIVDGLPRLFHVPMSDESRSLMALCILAVAETESRQTGRETILARLAELLFVDALRRYIDNLPTEEPSWFSGLRDPHIGAALNLIHGRWREEWTVDKLAREVGLSRSVFASRFAHFVGQAPIHYMTAWRMQLATHLLQRNGTNISRVASEVGYDSEAAFCRTFKRCVGVTPGHWRRRLPSEVKRSS
jgi:AraC-like DNA-binding protein